MKSGLRFTRCRDFTRHAQLIGNCRHGYAISTESKPICFERKSAKPSTPLGRGRDSLKHTRTKHEKELRFTLHHLQTAMLGASWQLERQTGEPVPQRQMPSPSQNRIAEGTPPTIGASNCPKEKVAEEGFAPQDEILWSNCVSLKPLQLS